MKEIPEGFHKHENGGGLVNDTAVVSGAAYIGPDARVYGSAQVYGGARVYDSAWVSGSARVSGGAWGTTPLYVQGTRHAVGICAPGRVFVGCEVHDIAQWVSNYEAIGKANDYTPAEIAEYGVYLRMMAVLEDMRNG